MRILDVKNGVNFGVAAQKINNSVMKTGDIMTGSLDMGGNKIVCSATDFTENELINKKFLETYLSNSNDWTSGDNVIYYSKEPMRTYLDTFTQVRKLALFKKGKVKVSFNIYGDFTTTYGEVKVFVGTVPSPDSNTNCVIHAITNNSNKQLLISQDVDINAANELTVYVKKNSGSGAIYVSNFTVSIGNKTDMVQQIV